ncbi:MAG TPA: phage tail sheath C-terminal domain-containing protein [Pricia sp.]|nr:phage tail sheath C-terminal domain-containing protein [Pricia sp.]
MITIKKTPGVYIEEISNFPPSVASVDTAVPAFIGYTDKEDAKFKAQKIYSLLDFEERYCDFNSWKLTYDVKTNAVDEDFSKNELYYHMQLYFANGGGKCYIISTGSKAKNSKGKKEDFLKALDILLKEDEPTLILMPEAAGMPLQSCMDVYKSALQQAAKLMDRFVIMDVPEDDGDKDIENFRNNVGSENLMFGAAYYPYLKTNITSYSKVSNEDIVFKEITVEDKDGKKTKSVTNADIEPGNMDRQKMIQKVKEQTREMPPSAAIAGVYATIDSTRGVWKSPANVSLNFVSGLVKKISHEEHGELNIHTEGGKSINAIRSFTGRGIMVWGARTLAGNNNEWRYINVRRFYNFVEESVEKATQQFVFEPNDANTWVRVSTMIENFLSNLWRQGALTGATPKEAFFVKVGLGVTMTMDDILNGIMNVEIGLAVVRPAEFIILKFSQKMQES